MPQLILRRSEERGYADHGWLKSHHTFSFADYYDPKFMDFGCLRVINEDLVKARYGFGTHPHRNAEIFTYMVKGEIEHKDSMNNVETIKRGQVQFTTAGQGILHSEKNEHPTKDVHLLQIWVMPNQNGLEPSYETLTYDESKRINTLLPLISPGNRTERKVLNTTGIHADFHMASCILEPSKSVKYTLREATTPKRKVYLQLVNLPGTQLSVNDTILSPGDGVFVTNFSDNDNSLKIDSTGKEDAEFVLMELS